MGSKGTHLSRPPSEQLVRTPFAATDQNNVVIVRKNTLHCQTDPLGTLPGSDAAHLPLLDIEYEVSRCCLVGGGTSECTDRCPGAHTAADGDPSAASGQVVRRDGEIQFSEPDSRARRLPEVFSRSNHTIRVVCLSHLFLNPIR